MKKSKKVCLIIPSLEPDEKLLSLLDNLILNLQQPQNSHLLVKILIINDGSSNKYTHIFEQAKNISNCILLNHAINLGVGCALKTAFNYFLNEFSDYEGVVTADSDGQHSAIDIIRCMDELTEDSCVILGVRDFSLKNIPFKSLIGNKLTRFLFNFFCGVKISDTQTGLRAIPVKHLRAMLTIPGERFEYAMNILIECMRKKISIKEIPIQTIYYENNKGTHFKALIDSFLIYKTIIKYLFSAQSSCSFSKTKEYKCI